MKGNQYVVGSALTLLASWLLGCRYDFRCLVSSLSFAFCCYVVIHDIQQALQNVGIYVDPTSLRFEVGSIVLYFDKSRNGWYEGKVVKVSKESN